MHTQIKVKCLKCGLHFIIFTWNKESHSLHTLYCPECGQHEGKFVIWQEDSNKQIFEFVPGLNAKLTDIKQ